ncbi:MAG: GMC family oxidoreductase, partial [Chitinophagaceae bacterium]|nr:GMC family oxidoreductase [Chitinophagaceae bacterium]
LDLHCKTHDIDNLYVVDASFFPSCGAFNPALTIAANALRVGDHIINTYNLTPTLSKGEGLNDLVAPEREAVIM